MKTIRAKEAKVYSSLTLHNVTNIESCNTLSLYFEVTFFVATAVVASQTPYPLCALTVA